MQLAEKIYERRKQMGLSQEQFAEKLDISRQAVSKWESGQSMPDLDKIIAMSELFGVSTDYLLKDTGQENDNRSGQEAAVKEEEAVWNESNINGMGGNETAAQPDMPEARLLDREETEHFMHVRKKAANGIALGVLLCIVSAAVVVLGDVISPETDGGVYVIFMFVLVMVAVGLFVYQGMALSRLHQKLGLQVRLPENLLKEIEEKDSVYHNQFVLCIVVGVMLCIGSVIPPIMVGTIIPENKHSGDLSAIALLCIVAVAVFLFVKAGITKSTYDILLGRQKTPAMEEKEKMNSLMGTVMGFYWCIVTAIYLLISFLSRSWGYTWIIWPVAGVLSGAIAIVINYITGKDKN